MNIAITGKGIVSAIGLDAAETLCSLRERRSGVGTMRHLRSERTELPVGEVRLSNDEMKQRIGIASDVDMSRTALLGIMAVRQALEEAGISTGTLHGQRVVLVSGTTVGGMDITEQHYDDLLNVRDGFYVHQHDCGGLTDIIASHFNIFAESSTLSTACSSALNALIIGARMLRANQADIVVAGGCEALSKFHLNGFNSLMILDKERCRPFCATRAGLNLGEGAAFVVLERDSEARSRGAQTQAYLTGYGNACDAFHQTASSENGEGAYRAMRCAMTMAGLTPADIDYVNAHGTGTPNNDQSETVALRRLFGDAMPPVSSTKAFTGHTTSASGSIEAVICMLAMRHRFLPANIGWLQPMEGGICPTMTDDPATLRHVMCNAFGFGGNDSSVVLSVEPQRELEAIDEQKAKIKVVAQHEVSSADELKEISRFVRPLDARRMGSLMRACYIASLRTLEEAGIETPDAIIMGTRFGSLEHSEMLLRQMIEEGEMMLKPTYFMQSTHNTVCGSVAIKTRCHGYNATYSQGRESLSWALRDARLLLAEGVCRNVLVGCYDEKSPLFRILACSGDATAPDVYAKALLLQCCE